MKLHLSLNDKPRHVTFISDHLSTKTSTAIQTSSDSTLLGTMRSSTVDFVPHHHLRIPGDMESKWYTEISKYKEYNYQYYC